MISEELRRAVIVDVDVAIDDVMHERPFKDRRDASKHLLSQSFDGWNAGEFQREAYVSAVAKRLRFLIRHTTNTT